MPQAYYNKLAGTKRLATETGAGQWGSSLALACQLFGLECTVYMVKVSFTQKPYRKSMMQLWGAQVFASPSPDTNAGRAILAHDPQNQGSLGIAISEAVEDAATHDDTKYALGSVLNHVILHQTVIGQEAKEQMKLAGDYPDVVIGCHGGGSNFSGLAFPFLADRAAGKGVRAARRASRRAARRLTKGLYAFDYGDTAKMAPIAKMYTLGHDFMPPGIHAGGLRYHGASPLVSQLVAAGRDRGERLSAEPLLRGGGALRPHRGDRPRARVVARDPRRHRRGAPGQGGGEGARHPVRPLRARTARHGRLRRLSIGAPGGLRVPGGEDPRVAGAVAQGHSLELVEQRAGDDEPMGRCLGLGSGGGTNMKRRCACW